MSEFTQSLFSAEQLISIDTPTLKIKLVEMNQELDDIHEQFFNAVRDNVPDCFDYYQDQLCGMQWAILMVNAEVNCRKPLVSKKRYH